MTRSVHQARLRAQEGIERAAHLLLRPPARRRRPAVPASHFPRVECSRRIADQDRESGASIVERAGDIKDARGPSKPPFVVKPGRTSGTVHLFARAAKTRASYEWAYSVDGTSWTCTEPTVRADKVVDGLVE